MAPAIKWWNKSINSVKGCNKITPGCNNCYACESLRTKDKVNPHCIFQSNPATDSRRFRPVIPFHSGHPFHSIPATGFGE